MGDDPLDPVTFEIVWHRLLDITEEMGIKYMRTSGSQVLLTGYDASTGITLPDGELVAMGPYITTQGNVLPLIVDSTLRLNRDDPGIRPGDMFICNDPYLGATHAPDVATVAPVFHAGQLVAWVGASGHWLDIGAIDPGGFSIRAVEVHEEGLRMPAVKIVEDGKPRADIIRWIMNQVRDPISGLDIRGQIAANNAGRERLEALFARYGLETVQAVMRRSIALAEERLRARLLSLPDGTWREVQYLDHDGQRPDIYRIVCTMAKRGERLSFDFSETDPQAGGFINCTYSGLRAGVLSAIYILLCWDLPWNQGVANCIELVCPPGLLVSAIYPAPTSMATISSIIGVIDTVFRPLSQLLTLSEHSRAEAMAVWTGTSLAPVVSGVSQLGLPFANTEMSHFAGGSGARTYADGVDTGGIIFNTTPSISNIETAEQDYPLLYLFRRQLRDSGGPGTYRGGASGELAYVVHDAPLGALEASFAGGGAEQPNGVGLAGGLPGATVRVIRVRNSDVQVRLREGRPLPAALEDLVGRRDVLPQKHARTPFPPEDVWYHNWQGGGGYGDPLEREPDLVLRDVQSGLVSPEAAHDVYGVVLQGAALDPAATGAHRQALREARVPRARPPAEQPARERGTLRYGEHLELDPERDRMWCGRCGHTLGRFEDDLRQVATRVVVPLTAAGPVRGEEYDRGRFQMELCCCPACGVQFEADVVQKDGPRPSFRLARPGQGSAS